jgi:hypothetical protein
MQIIIAQLLTIEIANFIGKYLKVLSKFTIGEFTMYGVRSTMERQKAGTQVTK